MSSPSIKSLESLSNSRAPKAASPEAVALITSASSFEALFLAAAQAVALDNPREGAALALKGMMYQDIKAGLGEVLQLAKMAQAADAMARAERASNNAATAESAASAAAASAAREEAREEQLHAQRLKQAELQTEREALRTEKFRATGSEY